MTADLLKYIKAALKEFSQRYGGAIAFFCDYLLRDIAQRELELRMEAEKE